MTLAPIVVDLTRGTLIVIGTGIGVAAVIATIWTILAERRQRPRRSR